jgi:hypothetical protein
MRPTTAPDDNIFDFNYLLHPGDTFERPRDVVSHPSLSLAEKRAILASCASGASAIASCPSLRAPEGLKAPVPIDDVLEALCALDDGLRHPPGGNPAVISLIVATVSLPGPPLDSSCPRSVQVGMFLKRPSDPTGRFRTIPGFAIVAATTSGSVLSLAAPWWLSAPSAPRGGAAAPADLGAAGALDDPPVPCDNSRFRRYDSRLLRYEFRILRYSCPSPALPFPEFFVTFPDFCVTNLEFSVTVSE